MATILNTTQVYSAADVVTHTNLNNILGGSTFVAGSGGATDDVTLEVNSGGSLQVKDGAITPAKLSTGGPRWSSTEGRLYVDGMLDSNNRMVAGIAVNGNLVGDLGYAFIDLHGDNTGTNEYVRLLNNNGTCCLQNKHAGRSIALETTDSGGSINTGLQVKASGVATLPITTNADINSEGSKAITTKEYVDGDSDFTTEDSQSAGYQVFPSGLKMAWGKASDSTTSPNNIVTFPTGVNFTVAPTVTVTANKMVSPSTYYSEGVTSVTTTQFTQSGYPYQVGYRYMAIGH